MKTDTFKSLDNDEMTKIDGGIVPAVVYGSALLGSFLVGVAAGHIFG